MAIFNGSMNYLRYDVVGELKQPQVEHLESALGLRRFVSLRPEGEDLESIGWVPLQRPFVDEVPLTNNYFLFSERVVFGFREDKIVLPRPMLKDLVQHRLEQHSKNSGEEPSLQTKHAVELAVRAELRMKLLPKTRIVDVMWDLSRRELRFFARGQGLTERFVEFFEESFELKLELHDFSNMAMREDLSLRSKAMLESLRPAEIFPRKVVVEAEGY